MNADLSRRRFLEPALGSAILLLIPGCGGGGSASPSLAKPNLLDQLRTVTPTRKAALTGANGIAIMLYQALYGKAPSYPMLVDYTRQIGAGDGFAWADAMAADLSSKSNADFSTLVLNNINVTATTLNATAAFGTSLQAYNALQAALADYLNSAGFARRGTVVMQLTEIFAGMENETTFGVYGNAAIAFNNQVTANFTYSSDVTHTVTGTPAPVPTHVVLCGSMFDFNHGHVLIVLRSDLDSTTAVSYDIQGNADHAHTVTLSAAQLTKLKTGASVTVTSTTTEYHEHVITVSCI